MEPTNKENEELKKVLAAIQNSPKEQGLSAADPLLTPIVQGIIMGKPLQWLGKGLKTVGKSLLSNSGKKQLVKRVLTDAEKAGIPKGERNSPSPYVRKGTVDEITNDFMSVTSPDVGQFIAKKSEHAVFNHPTDPTKVVKVYSIPEEGFSSIGDIRDFHKYYMKRNQIPYSVKTKFNGYLERNGKKYPIYIQDKVTPVPIKGDNYYEQYILPQIQEQLEKKGYKAIGSDTYSNGKFSITDLFEENIARTQNGDFVFFDPKVFGLGGVLVK